MGFSIKSPRNIFFFVIKPFMLPIVAMLVLIILGNGFVYSIPYFVKEITDIAIDKGINATFLDFKNLIIVIGSLALLSELSYRLGHIVEALNVPKMFDFLTSKLFEYIILQPTEYFEERMSGTISRRIEQISWNTIFFIESFSWEILWAIVSVVVTGAMIGTVHLDLFFAFCLWLLFFIVTSYPLLVWQYKTSDYTATSLANLSGATVDSIGNIHTVHTFAHYGYEKSIYGGFMNAVVKTEKKARLVSVVNKSHQGLNFVILTLLLIYGGVLLFLKQEITIGDFVILGSAIATFNGITWSIGDLIIGGIKRYGELSSAINELYSEYNFELREGEKVLEANKKYLHINELSFAYPNSSIEILRNINLTIKPGEKVGIVGKSGAGKSTLIKLLLRQYDPTKGSILIGKDNIKDVTLSSLRESITFVPQDTSLFQRTLYENILYSKPSAQKWEVIEASKHAHAEDFIMQYPEKYETKVGERGIKLSGGQRQRIALARAMLKNSPILILDEATSALDGESEEIVQNSLDNLFKGKTVIAIAHRLSTLRAMDRIIVIDNGMIVENGSPSDLLSKEVGVFKKMWDGQKSGFLG